MYSLLCFKEAVCPLALPHNVSLPFFFFFGAGSEDRCKTESTLYGVEEARIVISEGAVLQTTKSSR